MAKKKFKVGDRVTVVGVIVDIDTLPPTLYRVRFGANEELHFTAEEIRPAPQRDQRRGTLRATDDPNIFIDG